MATVVVAFDGTRLSGAESETDGGTWDKWGVTQSPTQETDFVYQGSFEISNKLSNTTGGIDFDATTAVDYSTTPKQVIAKVNVTTYGLINTAVAKGAAYQVGSSGSDYYEYNIYGSGLSYPAAGGWQIVLIDPNVSGYRDSTTGTPSLTAADYYGWWADITASVKSENIVHGPVDYFDVGTGLTLTRGDSTDTDGVFQDFIDTDEGNSSNRWGVVTSREDILYVLGVLTIGESATATEFTDSLATVVFLDARANAGAFGLDVDVQNASTTVTISNTSFTSKGTTATADTRAILDIIGTSGLVYFDVCNFVAFASITLTNSAELTNSVIDSSGLVTGAGALMTSTTISNSTVAANASALNWNVATDPNTSLNGMSFTKGTNAHHAIEFGLTSPTTMTLTDVSATGFNASDAQNDSTFHFKRTSGTVTLNLVGFTGNASYRTDGATISIVIDPVTELVNVKDNAGVNIQNARVLVETAATIASGEMFEAAVTSLTQSAGTATCTTTAVHGLATNDYVVIRGAQPDGYNKVAQVTVSSTTVFTYSVDSGLSTPATGTPVVSFVALYGLTDVSGNISATRTWGVPQQLKGWGRKKNTVSPFYKDGDIAYTVDNTNGNTVNVVLQPDE